jgi:hypothetical protein
MRETVEIKLIKDESIFNFIRSLDYINNKNKFYNTMFNKQLKQKLINA